MVEKLPEHWFVLPECPDDAGGLLYATHYGNSRLEAHRDQVLEVLKRFGVAFVEQDEGIEVQKADEVAPEDWARFVHLLEELSVLNEALEFQEESPDLQSQDLTSFLKGIQGGFITRWNNRDKVEAYHEASFGVPLILGLLLKAQDQGYPFSRAEKQAMKALLETAKRTEKVLGRRTMIVGGI